MNPTASAVYTEALLWALGGNPNQLVMQTNGERAYSMFAIMIIGCLTAYIVGAFFSIIDMLNKRDKMYEEALDELNMFIETKRLPHDLSTRLRAYFRLQNPSGDKGTLDSWSDVLKAMPTVLRSEVVATIGGSEWVTRVPYFSALPHALLVQLAVELKHISFPPCETLLKAGDDARVGALMVLHKGVLVTHSALHTQILPSSLSIVMVGEEALWPGSGLAVATMTSLTAVDVHSIQVAHLQALLATTPGFEGSVVRQGRRRWLHHKVRILVPAVRRVVALVAERAADPTSRPPSILELLSAAEGQHFTDAALSVHALDGARNKRPGLDRIVGRELSSLYVIPPALALLIVARTSPELYARARVAAAKVQRAWRAWRIRRKFQRMRAMLLKELLGESSSRLN